MSLTVKLGSDLRVVRSDLSEDLERQARDFLTVANAAKAKAVERGEWGAELLPDAIDLYRYDGDELVMPRGFAATLAYGVERMGGDLRWDDRTVSPSTPLRVLAGIRAPTLRPDQEAAAVDLLRHRQGILHAAPGQGKTVIGLDVWRRAGVTGLVCVGRIDLAEQWRARALEHLGVEAGLIGDGVWEERPLTIAMVPTLSARLEQLDETRFWERWGMTIIDECHHALAETFRRIIERTVSRYLIGKTATPLERDWRRPILEALLGPTVHRMADDGLVVPTVRVMKTPFKWAPKTVAEKRLVDSRAIYRRVIKALEADPHRMGLIVTTIMDQPRSCAQLVTCRRLDYLERMHTRLLQAGYPSDCLFFMRGKESRQRRAEVAREAADGSCVILATVADEGIDIPRLDRIHLTWPQRESRVIIQQVGRCLREHPEKTETIVLDYADVDQSYLRSQMYARVNGVYRAKGWPIEFVEA